MPTYTVIVEGAGIKIPDGPKPITGFFAARRVKAADEPTAAEKVKKLIRREWGSNEYREANLGSEPQLEIKEIRKLGLLLKIFTRTPTKGYTFY